MFHWQFKLTQLSLNLFFTITFFFLYWLMPSIFYCWFTVFLYIYFCFKLILFKLTENFGKYSIWINILKMCLSYWDPFIIQSSLNPLIILFLNVYLLTQVHSKESSKTVDYYNTAILSLHSTIPFSFQKPLCQLILTLFWIFEKDYKF